MGSAIRHFCWIVCAWFLLEIAASPAHSLPNPLHKRITIDSSQGIVPLKTGSLRANGSSSTILGTTWEFDYDNFHFSGTEDSSLNLYRQLGSYSSFIRDDLIRHNIKSESRLSETTISQGQGIVTYQKGSRARVIVQSGVWSYQSIIDAFNAFANAAFPEPSSQSFALQASMKPLARPDERFYFDTTKVAVKQESFVSSLSTEPTVDFYPQDTMSRIDVITVLAACIYYLSSAAEGRLLFGEYKNFIKNSARLEYVFGGPGFYEDGQTAQQLLDFIRKIQKYALEQRGNTFPAFMFDARRSVKSIGQIKLTQTTPSLSVSNNSSSPASA